MGEKRAAIFLLSRVTTYFEMASSSLSNNITKPEPEIEEESKDEFSVSVKQSTPTVVNEVQVWSPEQSRISVFGDRIRLDSTPKTSRSRR